MTDLSLPERPDYEPIHVMPVVDLIEHIESQFCECLPKLESNPGDDDIWVHRFLLEEYH